MNIHSGTLLISTPLLDGTDFDKAIIFIAEHNEKGALGFVVNHPFSRTLNELVEFNYSKPFALFSGGPVEKEGLFFLHRRSDAIKDGALVTGNVYLGGNFKKAVACINNNSIAANDIKLFIGYCGWDAGELEAEIEEGSWRVLAGSIEIVFSYNTEKMWEDLIRTKP
ncbi:MAG: YqgE/AlgH family protein [Bacteroidota bacterium]